MSLALTQSKTALAVNLTASFLATGGVEPYVYAVTPGGAGGSINSATGVYLAPTAVNDDPLKLFDTITVTDDNGDVASAQIMTGDALLLLCEIVQRELGLASDRVYIWDQKLFQPKDSGLYVIVSMPNPVAFGNNVQPGAAGGDTAVQSVNMGAVVDIDIISRGPAARVRKEEVLMALASVYSEQQQNANSFYIAKLPPKGRFVNLSFIDGAAIPYRFRISIGIQYTVTKTKAVPYYDDFEEPAVTTEP